jgi:hypothetical protein
MSLSAIPYPVKDLVTAKPARGRARASIRPA